MTFFNQYFMRQKLYFWYQPCPWKPFWVRQSATWSITKCTTILSYLCKLKTRLRQQIVNPRSVIFQPHRHTASMKYYLGGHTLTLRLDLVVLTAYFWAYLSFDRIRTQCNKPIITFGAQWPILFPLCQLSTCILTHPTSAWDLSVRSSIVTISYRNYVDAFTIVKEVWGWRKTHWLYSDK